MTRSAADEARDAQSPPQVTHRVRFDKAGRVQVIISLDTATKSAAATIDALKGMPGVAITTTNLRYRVPKVEAYVPPDELRRIASMAGVNDIVPVSPVASDVGAATTQAIVQHRIDKIPAGIDGHGITVGALSGSYDTLRELGEPVDAASDIRTCDLPGTGNPCGNTEPVVVLEDHSGANDEGRAMLQIIHDIAPKARLGFAQAVEGELAFADSIRALAGLEGAKLTRPDFKADIITDDLIYLSEPMFQDGIVAQAVDEVAAHGVSYFASAGSRPAIGVYDARPNIVPGVIASATGTNLDFSDVPPSLYEGGFHNFAPNGGLDIAQTVQFTGASDISVQWNEPFDAKPPTPIGAPLAQGTGTVPPDGTVFSVTFNGTAGQVVRIGTDSDDPTLRHPHPDVSLTLLDPLGKQIAFEDGVGLRETILAPLKTTGTYTVEVRTSAANDPSLFGDFVYRVQPVQPGELVRSDYNVLFFGTNGRFIGACDEDNVHTNRPLEICGMPTGTYQLVIARSNVPDPKMGAVADRIRYVGFSRVRVLEYFNYLNPLTFGHNSAHGAMGVASYGFFAPYMPENSTAPGPSTIYFDTDNKRLPTPEVRQKPDIAAMDGANNTFFGSDFEGDGFPNFFGTSAAAPHAAAIAALVLNAAGGPGTVRPAEMKRILQASAFPHDLDPFFASGVGTAGATVVSINAFADGNSIVSPNDPNVFTLGMRGPGDLVSFSIDGRTANPTQSPIGIAFDERAPPVGKPFTIGRTVGVTPADVRASFRDPANPPAVAGQWKALDLQFASGSFRDRSSLSFGVDRDDAATGGTFIITVKSADLLGSGVLLPSGEVATGGAKFFGTLADGRSVTGQFDNRLGHGYSPLDGFGFINAEAAVNAVLKK